MTPDPLAEVLRTSFGLERFRPWQREAIDAVLTGSGRVLVVAPTGGGKSLTYQVPAAVLAGTTLVLSPLVALMEDQVRALEARGRAGDVPRLDARAGRAPPPRGLHAARAVQARLRRARAARVGRVRRDARALQRAARRGRRGPLHRAVGARLPPRLPAHRRAARAAAAAARARVHGDGDARGSPRDPRAAPPRRPECTEVLRGFARPNLHLSARSVDGVDRGARRRVRGAGLGARRAGGPARRRHRLRRDAPPDRAMGRDAARAAAGTRPPTTRAWRPRSARAWRRASPIARWASSWRPTRSGWASTAPTSAPSSTCSRRRRSRRTTRRSGARAATAPRRGGCSSARARTSACAAGS